MNIDVQRKKYEAQRLELMHATFTCPPDTFEKFHNALGRYAVLTQFIDELKELSKGVEDED